MHVCSEGVLLFLCKFSLEKVAEEVLWLHACCQSVCQPISTYIIIEKHQSFPVQSAGSSCADLAYLIHVIRWHMHKQWTQSRQWCSAMRSG